jgi:NitT/TauT family transport system substrate-binding protein
MLPRKLALTLLLIAAALGLAACGQPTEQPTAMTPVTVYLGFRPDVQFAPFYVGLDRGIFAGQGLDVSLIHEAQESTMARLVATGEAPFAVISGEQVLLGRAEGLSIVYVFRWFQRYPVAVASKVEAGIVAPEDLAGRSVGVPLLSGASYMGLEALLASANLSDADIRLEATGFTQVETLLGDRVEAVVVYTTNEPVQLAAQDVDVNIIQVADYADLVSNGLITSEQVIRDDPALVRAMAAGLSEAIQYTIDHPAEAYEISKGHVEGLASPDVETAQQAVLARSIELWQADRLGESSLASWQATRDLLLTIGLLQGPVDLEAAFTNEFLP